MLSTEAIIALLALFSITGLFLNIAVEQNQKTTELEQQAIAIAEAQKCALIIDSVFSNAAIPIGTSINCYQEEKNTVESKNSGKKASATIIAPSVFLNQQANNATMEVKTPAHYK
jgi:hypothetical protein